MPTDNKYRQMPHYASTANVAIIFCRRLVILQHLCLGRTVHSEQKSCKYQAFFSAKSITGMRRHVIERVNLRILRGDVFHSLQW